MRTSMLLQSALLVLATATVGMPAAWAEQPRRPGAADAGPGRGHARGQGRGRGHGHGDKDRTAAPPGRGPDKDRMDKRLERIKQRAEERRATRDRRSHALRIQTRQRALAALRGKPMSQAFQQELRRHARRMARLARIQTVAAESGDVDVIQRVDVLLVKEKKRHQRWLEKHASKAGGSTP